MVKNNPEFGAYVKRCREDRTWKQDQVTEAGGPERHMLGRIESGAAIDLTHAVLHSLDQAFGLPAGNCRARLDMSPIEVTLNDAARVKPPFAPICGFADGGRPVGLPNHTISMLPTSAVVSIVEQYRHLVLVDIRAAHDDPQELLKLAARWANSGGRVFSTTKVRAHPEVQQVVIDPIPLASTLQAAREFVDALTYCGRMRKMGRERDADTSTAATLVWICSLLDFEARKPGELGDGLSDGLSALSTLARSGVDVLPRPECPRWTNGLAAEFFRKADLSAAAAKVDVKAVRFVAGLLRARDELTDLSFEQNADSEGFTVNRQAPPAITVTDLFDGPTLVFYDSWVSPELPAIVNWAQRSSFEAGSPPVVTLQLMGAHHESDAVDRADLERDGSRAEPYGVTIEVDPEQFRWDAPRGDALRDMRGWSQACVRSGAENCLIGWHAASRTAVLAQNSPEPVMIRFGLPGHFAA